MGRETPATCLHSWPSPGSAVSRELQQSSGFPSQQSARPSGGSSSGSAFASLNRTTRSVAPTQAGERLLRNIGPKFAEMDVELAAFSELREKPAGTLRITAIEYAADTILMPALAKLLPKYPDIKVEVITDYGLSNIVAERYNAGIRLGEQVANDMVAVRIGPDFRMVVVGSPTYFSSRKRPRTPQDLTGHNCINLRLPTYGGIYAWEFEKNRRELNVRVDGQLVFNGVASMLNAALNGLGLAYLPGRFGSAGRLRRASCQSPLRLVRAVFRLPSLLPEPSPALTRARRSR